MKLGFDGKGSVHVNMQGYKLKRKRVTVHEMSITQAETDYFGRLLAKVQNYPAGIYQRRLTRQEYARHFGKRK